jgi:hypothetical protein
MSPYVVPRWLGINEILTNFDDGSIPGPAARHPNVQPPGGTATFTNGRITALSIRNDVHVPQPGT